VEDIVPELVEIPNARMFPGTGIKRGLLPAYLISDLERSLKSILTTASIIRRLKAGAQVGLLSQDWTGTARRNLNPLFTFEAQPSVKIFLK